MNEVRCCCCREKQQRKKEKTAAINNRPMKLWTLARHGTKQRVYREKERTYGNITEKRDGPSYNGRPLRARAEWCVCVCLLRPHCGCKQVVIYGRQGMDRSDSMKAKADNGLAWHVEKCG